jgi:hypothetical protein
MFGCSSLTTVCWMTEGSSWCGSTVHPPPFAVAPQSHSIVCKNASADQQDQLRPAKHSARSSNATGSTSHLHQWRVTLSAAPGRTLPAKQQQHTHTAAAGTWGCLQGHSRSCGAWQDHARILRHRYHGPAHGEQLLLLFPAAGDTGLLRSVSKPQPQTASLSCPKNPTGPEPDQGWVQGGRLEPFSRQV